MHGHRAWIDGVETSSDKLGPPAMNYGQTARWAGYRRLEYQYEFSVPEFVNALDTWFETHRAEVRADDERMPPEPGSSDADFAAAGYPDLVDLMGGFPRLFEAYLPQFGLEINGFFGSRNPGALRYSVTSLDWIRQENDKVKFGGVAFDMQTTDSGGRRTNG